jgi:hypothetical protein
LKTSNVARRAVLLTALLAFAGLLVASAASAAVWNEAGEELTAPAPFSSPAKEASFYTVTEAGGNAIYMVCSIKTAGFVGPGSHGEITSVTSSAGSKSIECTQGPDLGVCPAGFVTIEALNLPWSTELTGTIPGEVRDLVKPGSKGGTPSWKIHCGWSTHEETCPYEVYSRFTKNGAHGAELAYATSYSRHSGCVSSGGPNNNTIEASYVELIPGYTIR